MAELRVLLQPHHPGRDLLFASMQQDRNRILEVFRAAISRPLSAASIALTTMQEAMKPQKQSVLVQEENQLLENGLRALLQELVGAAVSAGETVMQYGRSIDGSDNDRGLVTKLLDIILYLCEKGHVEGGMVFQLLEDLTEVSTIKDCKEVFGYIEGKQDILGKAELFGRGKLVMLRTCNQLLRRLSKANDVVFCGRILMFLAHFFPLSERSAVNIKGVHNLSNETKYEKEPPDGAQIDFNFYRTFWGLQEYLNNAPMVIQKWQAFSSSLATVLSTFEAQPLTEDDGSHGNDGDDASFNTKYLTSSNLMALELKDPNFRRHVLVQCLIVFDFLKTPGKPEKEAVRESQSLKDDAKLLENRVKLLLSSTPPKGKEFLGSIEHVLERDKNWLWWKREGCHPFERISTERRLAQDVNKKRRQRWRLGNKELSQLWKWADQNANALTDPERVKTPNVSEYWSALADDLDPQSGIEPEYSHKNNKVYCWKGLRFSAKNDIDGFTRFTDLGIEGVIPPELLAPDARQKIYGKLEKAKQKTSRKDEEPAAPALEENQGNGNADDIANAQDVEETAPMEAEPTNNKEEEMEQDEVDKVEEQLQERLAAPQEPTHDVRPMDEDLPGSRSPGGSPRNFRKRLHRGES